MKLFGDINPINWSTLGVKMPFAPMHELAKDYKLELHSDIIERFNLRITKEQILKTFELQDIDYDQYVNLCRRISYRTNNTISALDTCSATTICINLGGGYHHAGKYPDTGYAYSLINDIIWAVDYQLEKTLASMIGIIDLDYHFGGGTYEYYQWNERIRLYDQHHPKGELQKHMPWSYFGNRQISLTNFTACSRIDKVLLNIGTDWYKNDALFGQYAGMEGEDLLNVWKEAVRHITGHGTPLCITMGGGYGSEGLPIYQKLIEWIKEL